MVCGILVPRPGIEPTPPALEVWSLNHWTTREVPNVFILRRVMLKYLGVKCHDIFNFQMVQKKRNYHSLMYIKGEEQEIKQMWQIPRGGRIKMAE